MNQIGIMILDDFDKDLLQRLELLDTVMHTFGGRIPVKRLMQIDYKENGADMHVSIAVYQHEPVEDDETLIRKITEEYSGQGKTVSAVMEMDEQGLPRSILYVGPEFLQECIKDGHKYFNVRR